MHTVSGDEWPLSLSGPSAAADRARAAFIAAVGGRSAALIVADRGLGADAIARAIHEQSRPGAPLIEIDCAATGAQEVSRDLFGTPARADAHPGLEVIGPQSALLRARGGTIYVKHILDLPAAAQRRLARILRDGEVGAA